MDKEVVVHIPNEILLSYKKEQMDKEVVVHIPNEILLSYKKEQMDKEVVVHIPNEILFSYKKEHIWVNSNEVGETGVYCTEWTKRN